MTQTLNYEGELKLLKDSSNYWKAKQGKYKIEVLKEPEETVWNNDKGEVVQQWVLVIKVNGAPEQLWTIPKSYSPSSIRGQLVKLGAKLGKLAGSSFTLTVMGEGKERRYTILDLL